MVFPPQSPLDRTDPNTSLVGLPSYKIAGPRRTEADRQHDRETCKANKHSLLCVLQEPATPRAPLSPSSFSKRPPPLDVTRFSPATPHSPMGGVETMELSLDIPDSPDTQRDSENSQVSQNSPERKNPPDGNPPDGNPRKQVSHGPVSADKYRGLKVVQCVCMLWFGLVTVLPEPVGLLQSDGSVCPREIICSEDIESVWHCCVAGIWRLGVPTAHTGFSDKV